MAARPLVSPFIAADPIRPGTDVTSAAKLTTALVLPVSSAVLALVPGVALVLVPAPRDERLSLRWIQLPHEPALRPGGPPSGVALVLLAPPFGLAVPAPAEWTLVLAFPAVISASGRRAEAAAASRG